MPDPEDPESLLNALSQGDVPDATLYELSDLHGERLARLTQDWPSLPEERRLSLIARLVEIAEDSFEVDFSELFKICLNDAHAQVRSLAIEGLWEVEDVGLVRPLLKMLRQDPSVMVREAAVISVSRFALMAELDRLQPRMADMVWDALWQAIHSPGEDVTVRRRAVESLAYFDRPEVKQVIEAAYADVEPKMRISAVFAMGRTADQEWSEKIMTELETEDVEMRYEATRACGELRLDEATPALSLLVADADPEVRLAAVWSLGQIGTPEARRVLDICSEEGDEAIQDAANEALDEIEFMEGSLEFPLYDYDPERTDDTDLFWDDEEDLD